TELERLASERMDLMTRTIELRRRGESEATLDILRTNSGKIIMDSARRVIAEMREYEDRRLEERTAVMRRNFDRATSIEIGAGVGLLALGFVLFMVHRDLSRREALEKALRQEATFQQQFMGILGHDLRNPLGAISMSAGHLRRAFSSTSDSDQATRI